MAIYLDHNATTPLDERVLEAMLPYLRSEFGNPSSGHALGRVARAALDLAREQVAALVTAHPSQVIFTGGGSEANNLALKGVAARQRPAVLAVSAVEHASVRVPALGLARQGWDLRSLPVDAHGRLETEGLQRALHARPVLVAMMLANNETGVVYDVASVAAAACEAGALLHCDAVQAAGKQVLDFPASGAHLMTLSAHKLYGPKGVGALVVDKAVDLAPLIQGGGQEKGYRAGTENVAAIVGFGRAAELAVAELEQRQAHMRALQERLEGRLRAEIPALVMFGEDAPRLPNTTFFAVPGIDGETLIVSLDQDGLAVASGSACHTGEVQPSHVLLAMGVSEELARGAVRVSLGKDTTAAEVDTFVACLTQRLKQLQGFGSLAFA